MLMKHANRRISTPFILCVSSAVALLALGGACSPEERDIVIVDDPFGGGAEGDGDVGDGDTGDGDGDGDGDMPVPVDCENQSDCPEASPVCDAASQMCRGCASDQECVDLGGDPFCESENCVECKNDFHCDGETPFCGDDNRCRGCVANDECDTKACARESGLCVAESDAVFALAQTGVTGADCGTLDKPCNFIDDAAAKLSPTRPNLVLIPTSSEFKNYNMVIPSGVDVVIYGNDVKIRSGATPIVSQTGGSLTMFDMDIAGSGSELQTLVSCDSGSLRMESSILADSGTAVDAQDCDVDVSTSQILRMVDDGILALCAADPCDSVSATIERSIFDDMHSAVTVDHVDGEVRNNVFIGIALAPYDRGIRMNGPDSKFIFNTVYGSGNCAFTGLILCNDPNVIVSGNLTYANTEGSGPCYDQVYYDCDGAGNSVQYAFAETTWIGSTNRSGDPKLTDPAGGDFTLMSDSPAIDIADSSVAPMLDFAGNPRVSGSAPDAGAFEFQQ